MNTENIVKIRCENCIFFSPLMLYKRKLKAIGNDTCISGVKIEKELGYHEESGCCLLCEKDNLKIWEVLPNDKCENFIERIDEVYIPKKYY